MTWLWRRNSTDAKVDWRFAEPGPKVVRESSMAEYYYLDAGRSQQGPVPPDEIARLIRGGTIRRDTMVWSAGMPEWSAAGQVSDLAPLFAQAAPPRPAGPPPARPPMQRAPPGVGGYHGQPRPRPSPQYHPAAQDIGLAH